MRVTSQPRTGELTECPALDTGVKHSSRAASRTASRTPSPAPTAPTTINYEDSVAARHWERNTIPLSAVHTVFDESIKIRRKQTTEGIKMPVEKRPKTATDNSHRKSTRQLLTTATQASALSHSLKVTKSMSKAQGPISTKSKDTISFLVQAGHVPDYRHAAQIQASTDTFGQLTPRPASIYSSGIDLCRNEINPLETVNEIHNACAGDDSSDAYPLEEDITDNDMIQLLTLPPVSIKENHIPPSSVQGWDHDSQSAAEYDPTLNWSPPDPPDADHSATGIENLPATRQTHTSEDLLDEDVDWNTVLANTNALQESSPINSCTELQVSKFVNLDLSLKRSINNGCYSDEAGSLTAFSRPPFPGKVRDRPSVPGMSSDMLLRTCFRIGAMISQTAWCFNHQQNVVFELYARVTYSSRETLSRKQHFQFVDLFKDQQPYPAATLMNWRIDSQLDKHSATFLDTRSGPRLCWCMCKPIKDSKAALGWTYTILKIKEIDWEQIRWAKTIVCGDCEVISTEQIVGEVVIETAF
ncbi:hypothetical protein F5Y09DRAFT_338335 [Xylaria sp. FL1042]|nr:hypothetical protein F5Y09DRAFT_338335 [Xylaria sp. FL1042]